MSTTAKATAGSALNELRVVVKALETHNAEADKKRKARDRWIIKAHKADVSLRDIAEAAGISHMAVKKVIDKTKEQ